MIRRCQVEHVVQRLSSSCPMGNLANVEDAAPRGTGEGDAGVRVGELARRVGVSPAVLRAWERRYGLLRPQRSRAGQRLYPAADEARVRAMLDHMDRGYSAAIAARLAAEPAQPAAPSAGRPGAAAAPRG